MSVAEWDNEYARLARAASQLRTSGLSPDPSASGNLQTGLQRLEQGLSTLPLGAAEVQRRRRLVQHLKQQAGGSVSAGGSGGGGGLGGQSQMTMAMRQQDALIDDLAVGVGRLKHQTVAVGEEARMHVNLLNDMDTGLDAAQQGLEDQTRRAARLKEDQSVWRLQLIVAGLFILLILLILMGLSP